MAFRTSTVLAIAISLGICLFLFILTSLLLGICLFSRRSEVFRLYTRIQDLEEKLDTFAKVLNRDGNVEDGGTSSLALPELYRSTWGPQPFDKGALERYTEKWFSYEEIMPSVLDEVTRLKDALYPTPPPSSYSRSIDRDLSIFPNPQQYTTTEIATLLHVPGTRHNMITHLMVSTLLKNTSIKGNPAQSLLPLLIEDINGLYNLSNAVRNGLHLGSRLHGHMKRFGFYKSITRNRSQFREPFHQFFETLFQPYFKSNSPEDVQGRRVSLNEVFDSAIAYAMEILSYFGEVEYNWGEKKDSSITLVPALVTLQDDGCFMEKVERYEL